MMTTHLKAVWDLINRGVLNARATALEDILLNIAHERNADLRDQALEAVQCACNDVEELCSDQCLKAIAADRFSDGENVVDSKAVPKLFRAVFSAGDE